MTYEKALQSVLTYCIEECGKMDAYRCENKECVEAAVIKALEKQVPKKPPNHDGMVCPSCNSKARYGHPYEYYCPHCGQAIDWSD